MKCATERIDWHFKISLHLPIENGEIIGMFFIISRFCKLIWIG